jgi:hypothetical protein
MTLKLMILAAALMAVSGCAVSPYGDSPAYYTSNGPRERDFDRRDAGDRSDPVGHEAREYGDQRYRN